MKKWICETKKKMVNVYTLHVLVKAAIYDLEEIKGHQVQNVSDELYYDEITVDDLIGDDQESKRLHKMYHDDPVDFEVELTRLYDTISSETVKILHSFVEDIGFLQITLRGSPTYRHIVETIHGLGLCSINNLTVTDNIIIIQ